MMAAYRGKYWMQHEAEEERKAGTRGKLATQLKRLGYRLHADGTIPTGLLHQLEHEGGKLGQRVRMALRFREARHNVRRNARYRSKAGSRTASEYKRYSRKVRRALKRGASGQAVYYQKRRGERAAAGEQMENAKLKRMPNGRYKIYISPGAAARMRMRNPGKWILPYKRGHKNYENVGAMPFALEHDIGFAGEKMYKPVKVQSGGGITVASSELHSVDYDPHSRKSAVAAVRKLHRMYE